MGRLRWPLSAKTGRLQICLAAGGRWRDAASARRGAPWNSSPGLLFCVMRRPRSLGGRPALELPPPPREGSLAADLVRCHTARGRAHWPPHDSMGQSASADRYTPGMLMPMEAHAFAASSAVGDWGLKPTGGRNLTPCPFGPKVGSAKFGIPWVRRQ